MKKFNFEKKQNINNLAISRFVNRVVRKRKKEVTRFREHQLHLQTLETQKVNETMTWEKALDVWMPPNLKFLISNKESRFEKELLAGIIPDNNGDFIVPVEFSIVDKPEETFHFLRELTSALIYDVFPVIQINYIECKRVDLGAQVLLDLILMDFIKFWGKCNRVLKDKPLIKNIGSSNYKQNLDIFKLLHSVGSLAIHARSERVFPDIIRYKLCVHDREKRGSANSIEEQKEIDTTQLADYVQDCLRRLGRKLSPAKLYDLCTVIGEILINAEEHSSTKYRFSIGYFHEKDLDGVHCGVFRLVILNFGKTIYQKFSSPDCENTEVVGKMKALSESYNSRKWLRSREFEEETLWTLYALQDGVTSVPSSAYKRRGHGSIQFIESFFNLKGRKEGNDDFSRMVVMSGSTKIVFDGTYNIVQKERESEVFKFMTFNESGNIDEKPDANFVRFVDDFFPGTIISARIMFNEDDFQDGK